VQRTKINRDLISICNNFEIYQQSHLMSGGVPLYIALDAGGEKICTANSLDELCRCLLDVVIRCAPGLLNTGY